MPSLLVTPQSTGSFYFSGSQSITKGAEVAWILDDTFAFKTTEECAVSANKTPFVQLQAGQTFIIKKGMPYIFDRDTVVGLAYPQENVQDIIIENDIYNNNMNAITIEANQAPTVSAGANQIITLGDEVTLYSTAIPVSPATISSYSWLINGSEVATTANYTFTPTAIGDIDVTLIVTDSDGRKAYDSVQVTVEAVPIEPDVVYTDTNQYVGAVAEASWITLFQVTADQTLASKAFSLNYTAGIGFTYLAGDARYAPSSMSVRLRIGTTTVWSGTITPTSSPYLQVGNHNFTASMTNGDAIKLEVYWTDVSEYASSYSVCTNGCTNGEMQVTIDPN